MCVNIQTALSETCQPEFQFLHTACSAFSVFVFRLNASFNLCPVCVSSAALRGTDNSSTHFQPYMCIHKRALCVCAPHHNACKPFPFLCLFFPLRESLLCCRENFTEFHSSKKQIYRCSALRVVVSRGYCARTARIVLCCRMSNSSFSLTSQSERKTTQPSFTFSPSPNVCEKEHVSGGKDLRFAQQQQPREEETDLCASAFISCR